MNPLVKILIEAGPLIAFFLANWLGGIFWATGIFMAAIVLALALSWILTRKLAIMPLISAGFVAVFGVLTLWLHDETFIKVKVTLINALFGVVLLGGLFFRQTFLKFVMGEAIKMTDEGWRALTIRWGIFFLFVAVANEVVWRMVSTDTWVNFKVALLPVTVVFALSQAPMMTKHMIQDEPQDDPKTPQ
jgi:intracellular septation protein